jgi:alpha-1,6-mannosyltransferase
VTRHERQARSAPRIDLTQRLSRPASLRGRVHVLGAIALLAYASMTILSFVQAAALWRHEPAPRTQAFFETLSAQIQPVLPFMSGWLLDNRPFEAAWSIVLSYWIPLAIASAAVLALVLSLLRRPESAGPGLPKLLAQWSYGFAAVCALAFPVFTQDFWLSAAWGRMIAAGLNPFHTLFTPESLTGLPLDHFPMPMSYGPLWGLVSGAIMLIAGDSVIIAAVLFKAVIAVAWIGSLHLVCRLTESLSQSQRCLAIAVFGWMPAGVSQSLAEGHNDIAMVALALLWLFQLMRGRSEAPIALVASALCKYVTAPLLLIDALYALRHEKIGWRRYTLRLALPAALGLATMALFYRSPEFFDGVRLLSTWYFLQPRDAVQAVELALDLPLLPLELAVTALFPAYASYTAWTAWNEPTTDRLLQAALAVMSAVLFTAVGHLWPWYVIWALALAVLMPSWWLSRFIIGVAVMSPFTLGFWWVEPFANHREVVAFAMYAFAILWTVVTRPGPFVQPLRVAERA